MIFADRAATATVPAASPPAPPIRVMICDDSLVIRGAITRLLEADRRIRVVARAGNGRQAIEELRREKVDVIILDIEMPVMDGITALPLLLRTRPGVRVIMASTLTTRGADIALRALRLGAADYVPKPSAEQIADASFAQELLGKVLALARPRPVGGTPRPGPPPSFRPRPALAPRLLAIGSSTGGPQALFTLVRALGREVPVPVVVTQHMPATFTPILAEHIARLGAMPCAEARDGEALRAGHIHLAPGNRHLLVRAVGGTLRAHLSDEPPENFCRPAVDPMLRSAAEACAGRVLVVMLTGMGQDGLAGTRAVVGAGGVALAQDEASSVVWGMPGAIAQAGLCHAVVPIDAMAGRIRDLLRGAA